MKGILLVNLGTPVSTNKADVKQFIGEMLSDPYVTGLSPRLSSFLAKKIISPFSAAASTAKYQQIWRKEEPQISPLLYHMRELASTLEKKKNIAVEITMRYGEPDLLHAFRELERKCPLLHEVVVFPLYPHHAQSTTETMKEHIGRIFFSRPHSFRLRFVEPYYNHPAYIQALADLARPYLNDIDKLVFTYHSLPVAQVESAWRKGKEHDYVYQLKETNHLFCHVAGIDPRNTFLFYSSQRGRRWLKPFLNRDISDLPGLGWKRVAVMAPGFPIDNMETLYDIDIEARKLFMEAGGERFSFVPSLNNHDSWVEAIWKIVEKG